MVIAELIAAWFSYWQKRRIMTLLRPDGIEYRFRCFPCGNGNVWRKQIRGPVFTRGVLPRLNDDRNASPGLPVLRRSVCEALQLEPVDLAKPLRDVGRSIVEKIPERFLWEARHRN